ncbi:MAG: TIGR04283 family arsenosugar biosynthesis glycosyltransferase [Magnetococcales bacterium]|nr:TIGR04283 family arsenosugar biosynthesis glycosyltransferase [Magnetococcales bacterium]
MNLPHLSIIIPTLNESDRLPSLIRQIRQSHLSSLEIIVADGGSSDGTSAVASKLGDLTCQAPRGRGAQMNAGAKRATGSLLLFLHADSTLRDPSLLRRAVTTWIETRQTLGHDRLAGHFSLQFIDQPPGKTRVFRFYEAKTALNRPHCTNGDQGFLMSRDFFWALGGFDERLPFLEDQILASQIYQQGVWITLPGTLQTSARRFHQEGLARRMILSALIMAFHNTGFQLFFERAPALYRQQDRTRPLQLAPFFSLINQLNREATWQVVFGRWRKIGYYVREAAWQPFFLLDLLGAHWFNWRRRPFLAFHDRIFHPLTQSLPFDLLAALLTWTWFRMTGFYFFLSERNHP